MTPSHSFTREGGTGLEDTLQPVCSCGWRGLPIPGWNDFQLDYVANQEKEHLFRGYSVDELREGAAL